MATSTDTKTTVAGAVAGGIVAFGQPILDLLSSSAHVTWNWKNLVFGIALAVLGKFAAGTKKE